MYTYTYIHTCILGVGGRGYYYTIHTQHYVVQYTHSSTHTIPTTLYTMYTHMLCSTHTTLYMYTIHTHYTIHTCSSTHTTPIGRVVSSTHTVVVQQVGRQARGRLLPSQPATQAHSYTHMYMYTYTHIHTHTTLCVYTYIHTYNVLYYTHTCIHYYYTILYQQVGSTMYLGHHVLYCATQGRRRMWQALSYCNRGFWQKALRKVVKKITKKFSLNPLTRCAQCGILRVPRDRESLRAQAHTHVETKQRAQLVKHLTKTRSLLCKGVESV